MYVPLQSKNAQPFNFLDVFGVLHLHTDSIQFVYRTLGKRRIPLLTCDYDAIQGELGKEFGAIYVIFTASATGLGKRLLLNKPFNFANVHRLIH